MELSEMVPFLMWNGQHWNKLRKSHVAQLTEHDLHYACKDMDIVSSIVCWIWKVVVWEVLPVCQQAGLVVGDGWCTSPTWLSKNVGNHCETAPPRESDGHGQENDNKARATKEDYIITTICKMDPITEKESPKEDAPDVSTKIDLWILK